MPEPRNLGPRPISDLFANCDPLTQARAQVPPKTRKEDTDPEPVENTPALPAPGSDPAPNSPEDIGFTKRRELPKEILGFCRSCHAPIYWIRLNGKPHPVERGISPKGTIALTLHPGDDSVTAELVEPGSRPNLHLSHFARCPSAGQWRKS